MHERILNSASNELWGGHTCGNCGIRHWSKDIYGGKYDMRAPDDVIARALEDKGHTKWNSEKRAWIYMNQELLGSERFASAGGARPSSVKHKYSEDGKILFSTLAVDTHHLSSGDVKEVDELLASIATQIREGGSFRPCLLSFVDYDDDQRAICEIPEIRRWCAAAWKQSPALVALLDQNISSLSRMFLWCLVDVQVAGCANGRAQFTVSVEEYRKTVQEAAFAAQNFLESCGYSDATTYVVNWAKSLGAG